MNEPLAATDPSTISKLLLSIYEKMCILYVKYKMHISKFKEPI